MTKSETLEVLNTMKYSHKSTLRTWLHNETSPDAAANIYRLRQIVAIFDLMIELVENIESV